ncbi:MAG: serine/threonine-protein kinase, partial [Planctomycetota bacterium]
MQSPDDNECLIESLVERDDTFSHTGELTDSLIQKVRGDLELLQGHLRQPPPADPFGEESACEQALNLVAAIGRDPSFSTRQQLAAEQALSPDEQSALPGGGVLGQYRLLTKLGEGGMGVVYKALHTRLDKVVALKLLTANRLQNEQAVSRFDREMRAVGKLHHTNIVAAHDAGEIAGTHYLVMELVDGIDLRELVKQHGRLPIGAACELIRQAALGLQHVHAHGLVHRDIKPSNLMLTLPANPDEAPAVKVLDLGLALLDEAHLENFEELTATGQVMGTLEYMAPEQGADTHSVDIRADIYGLGASLYKLLTGKAPFSSDQYRSPIKLLMALATQDPPSLITRCPEITPELEAVVQRMLAKKPADRYATPRELAEALAPFSQPADLRALVDFLATAAAGDSVDVNAPAFVGTHRTPRLNGENGSRQQAKDVSETTTYIAAVQPKSWTHRRHWSGRLAVALATCGILIAAAIYVIQIRTDQGELVIQSDYAGVTVKIKRDGAEVRNGWSLLKGQDNKQLIRTGQIEIELPVELTGEYTVTPSLVTLTKGDQEVVKIERKEPRPAPEQVVPPLISQMQPAAAEGQAVLPKKETRDQNIPHFVPPQGFLLSLEIPGAGTSATGSGLGNVPLVDRDRAAAEWLIHRGGFGYVVADPTGERVLISPEHPLPAERFIFCDLTSPPPTFNNEDLSHFAGLQGLTHLTLANTKVDSFGIDSIRQMPRLQVLQIYNDSLTTSALKGLCDLPFLHEISLAPTQVDDGWDFIKDLPYLRSIRVSGDYEPSTADFRHWGQFRQLRSISISVGTEQDEAKITPLREQNPLCQVHIYVQGDRVQRHTSGSVKQVFVGSTPKRIAAQTLLQQGFGLSHFDWLGKRFVLTEQAVRDEKNTQALSIQFVKVPPQLEKPDLSGLGQFPFVWMDAADLQRADIFAKNLPQSTVVQEINLKNSDLTDAGLQQLQRLDPFVVLNVQGSKVTKAGIEAFQKARPACTIHSDFGFFDGRFPDATVSAHSGKIATIDRDRIAAELWLSHGHACVLVLKNTGKNVTIEPGQQVPGAPFALKIVYMTVSPPEDYDLTSDLDELAGLQELQMLLLQGPKPSARSIDVIRQIPRLRELSIAETEIWTSALSGLGELPLLRRVDTKGSRVDDDWQFIKDLKYLRVMRVREYLEPSVTDFQRWSDYPQLREIYLKGNPVSDEMVAKLQEKHPLCRIITEAPLVKPDTSAGFGASSNPNIVKVVGTDPVRVGAEALLSYGFRLTAASSSAVPYELIEESLRDNKNLDPLWIVRVTVPAEFKSEQLSKLCQFAFDSLDAMNLQQADMLAKNLPVAIAVEEINLNKSDLTDGGLQQLQRLDPFATLNVQGTKVTAAGIEAFKKARPACKVLTDTLSSPKLVTDGPAAGTPQATLAVDPDRAAAQGWLLRGGHCSVVLKSSGKPRHIHPGLRFPRVPFALRSLSAPKAGMVSEDLKPFVGLAGLQSIDMDGSNLDAQALDYLSQIPSLRRITLLNTQIWTSEFAPLRKLPFLHEITLNTDQVDDDWKFLSDLPHLRSLKLSNYNDPSLADIQKWCEFPQLRSIQLEGAMIPERLITNLHEKNSCCRVLAQVLRQPSAGGTLRPTPFEARQIETIGTDPVRLGAAELLSHGFRLLSGPTGTEITQTYVRDQRNTDLFTIGRVLVPPQAQFTEETLAGLNKFYFTRLDAVDLRQADTFAKHLPASMAVDEINLSQSDLTDAGLQELQRLDLFPILNVQGTKVTLEGITAFQQAKPVCLVISSFNPSSETTPLYEVPPVLSLPQTPADRERAAVELWQQRLGGGKFGSSSGESSEFTARSQLPVRYFELIAGRGTGIKGLTNADLEHLTNLTSLEMLAPWGQGVDAQAVHYLKRMPTVTDFDLTEAHIPTSTLTELRTLPRLSQLGLSGSMIDDNWKFLDQLPGVRKLRLSNFRPTPADWQRFQELPQLREIRFLDSFDVDEAG